jgi:membrane protein implicated in regulation of membrane protease activity
MFEIVATRTAHTLYALVIASGLLAFAWLCLANFSFWVAVLAFCMGLPLLALVATPLAAGGSLVLGILAGLVAKVFSAGRQPRSDG